MNIISVKRTLSLHKSLKKRLRKIVYIDKIIRFKKSKDFKKHKHNHPHKILKYWLILTNISKTERANLCERCLQPLYYCETPLM